MPGNYVALMVLCVLMVLVGLWTGWLCWGRDLKRAEASAKIMSAGYRVALLRVTDALELWERTRGGWQDDGTTTVPAATAAQMAQALGYARTAALACKETPNGRAEPPQGAEEMQR